MDEIFGMAVTPFTWVVVLLFAGFGFVALAKIYGLLFMGGKSPHRVGDAMNVDRAEVIDWSGDEGQVMAGGEIWKASSKDNLQPGDYVTIAAMNGLILQVKKKR